MDFEYNAKTRELQARLLKFMDDHIYPNEKAVEQELAANTKAGKRWTPLQTIEALKPKARAAGLWNLFLPVDSAQHAGYEGGGLTNLEYAPLAEIMGRVQWSSEAFNCSAPDTGNMETIARYGSDEIKARWLKPLLEGQIRSAFAMTEPEVASADATNICTSIKREGDEYVINGHKWWTSGAADPRCAVFITMGKTDPDAPKHSQQSMIIVPADTKGVRVVRPLSVFGYDDAPHGHAEMYFENVRVPVSQHPAGRRPRLRDRPGPPGPRPHPPLHAPGRPGRARAGADVPALVVARRVRQDGCAARRHPGADCRSALQDRHGAPADAQGGVADGHRGQQGGQDGHRDDQGGGAEHGLPGDRLGNAGPRRRRRQR